MRQTSQLYGVLDHHYSVLINKLLGTKTACVAAIERREGGGIMP